MPHLELIGVSKRYDGVTALNRLSLNIEQGERLALLGPSGCGKTTTMNLIAGFLDPDEGAIRIAGRDMAGVPAHKRKTGMVFQTYALFPHLTVFENLAFGLRIRKLSKHLITQRVERALAAVRLESFQERYPRQLSGGQQQRVALARALVIEPDILLLDEPLSNLDAKLRQQMRVELLDILRAVGTTTILVTHDQEEALALADRVAVMNEGRLEQVGPPAELYEDPSTPFVAKFLGESNTLSGVFLGPRGQYLACDIGGGITVSSERATAAEVGAPVEVILRVERLQLSPSPLTLSNCFQVRLEHVLHLGMDLRYIVRLGEHRLVIVDKNRSQHDLPPSGTDMFLAWPARETLIMPVR